MSKCSMTQVWPSCSQLVFTTSCLSQILVYFLCIFKVGFIAHALSAPQEWQISELSSIAQHQVKGHAVGAIQVGNV